CPNALPDQGIFAIVVPEWTHFPTRLTRTKQLKTHTVVRDCSAGYCRLYGTEPKNRHIFAGRTLFLIGVIGACDLEPPHFRLQGGSLQSQSLCSSLRARNNSPGLAEDANNVLSLGTFKRGFRRIPAFCM